MSAHDRVDRDAFPLTLDVLAAMAGVPRADVLLVGRALEEDGAIRYARGQLTVIDRARLERLACSCYHVIAAALAPPPARRLRATR